MVVVPLCRRSIPTDAHGTGSVRRLLCATISEPAATRTFDVPTTDASLEFPDHPLYTGNPWFLPLVGGYYRMRGRLDRLLA
jgi:hypothetical protein